MRVEVKKIEPIVPPIDEVILYLTLEEAEFIVALSYFHEVDGENVYVKSPKITGSGQRGKRKRLWHYFPEEILRSAKERFGLSWLPQTR